MQQILCAIYTRLSKEDEDKQQPESESIQNQKSLLTRYATDHGWDIYSIFMMRTNLALTAAAPILTA